jgi:hypothetical protein
VQEGWKEIIIHIVIDINIPAGRKMSTRPLVIVALWVLISQWTAAFAMADTYDANSSPFHITVTITSEDIDVFRFSVGNGQKAEWKVEVISGSSVDVYVVDSDQISPALSGGKFKAHGDATRKYTMDASGTEGSSGDFAVLVTTSSSVMGNSTFTVDVTKRGYNSNEWLTFAGLGLFGLLILVVGIFKARRIWRAIRAIPRPQKYPAPAVPPQVQPEYPVGIPQSSEYACPGCGGPTLFSPQLNRYCCIRENRWL